MENTGNTAHIEQFLQGMDAEYKPAALHYYQTAFQIIEALNPPQETDYGFACMQVLETVKVTLADGTVFDEDFGDMGLLGDIAKVVAVYFAPINSDYLFWKSQYVRQISYPNVVEKARLLTKRLQTVPFIKQVESF